MRRAPLLQRRWLRHHYCVEDVDARQIRRVALQALRQVLQRLGSAVQRQVAALRGLQCRIDIAGNLPAAREHARSEHQLALFVQQQKPSRLHGQPQRRQQ